MKQDHLVQMKCDEIWRNRCSSAFVCSLPVATHAHTQKQPSNNNNNKDYHHHIFLSFTCARACVHLLLLCFFFFKITQLLSIYF